MFLCVSQVCLHCYHPFSLHSFCVNVWIETLSSTSPIYFCLIHIKLHPLNLIWPGLTQAAQGNTECFWPTPRCWKVAWQPARRYYQSPWRYPDQPVGCTGVQSDCWGTVRLAAAGKWARTLADLPHFLRCCCCCRTRLQGRWRHLWAWWRGWGSAVVGCDRVELL